MRVQIAQRGRYRADSSTRGAAAGGAARLDRAAWWPKLAATRWRAARRESLQTTVSLPRFAVALWSPERPALYRLTGELIAGSDTLHRLTRVVGFKQVVIRGGDLFLNGAPLKVRGIDYVPEDATAGRAISEAQIRQDLTRIRELGMNVVRVPFAPPPPALARAGRRTGAAAAGGRPTSDWIPGDMLNRPAYRNLVTQTYDQMVATLRDHVSVLAWGLGGQLNWREPATQRIQPQAVRDAAGSRMRGPVTSRPRSRATPRGWPISRC